MALLAYNRSVAPVTLAGTSVVLPASLALNHDGPAVNVTAALTGLLPAQFDALEAQRLATPIRYVWTDKEEFSTVGAAPPAGLNVELPAMALSLVYADQITWWVDPVAGDDANDGAADANGRRLKTVGECMRRLQYSKPGKNYQVNVINDVPASDIFRPAFIKNVQSKESFSGVTGTEQIFNMTMNGKRIVGAAGNLTYTATAAGVQAQINSDIVLAEGDMIQTATGYVGWVGKDLGAGNYRVSELTNASNAFSADIGVAVAFNVITLTKWNGSMIQQGDSQGRYQVNDFHFPAPAAVPADQQNIAIRNANFTFRTCLFERPLAWDFGMAATAAVCCFKHAALGIDGVVAGGFTYLGNLFYKSDVQLFAGVTFMQFNSNYIQDGKFQTKTTTSVPTYGASVGVAATCGPAGTIAILGKGLGIYDAPGGVGTVAALFSDGARVRLGAGSIYGNASAETGVAVTGGSKLMIATGLQVSSATSISGTTNELLLEGAPTALPPLEGSAGAILPALSPMTTWDQWNAAPFSRKVMNHGTGAAILNVAV